MSTSIIISLILIGISLAVILTVIFRKFPQLTILDVNTHPDTKEEKKKVELLKKRADESAQKKKEQWKKRVEPIRKKWRDIQLQFRQYVGKVEKDILTEQKRQEKLVPLTKEEIARREQEVRQLLKGAKHALEKESWEEAEKQYIAAIRLDKKNVEAYRGLGDVYFAQHHLPEAEQTYTFLLQLEPNNDNLLMRLGELAEEQGKIEKAIDYYQQAVLTNPHLSNRFAKLASLLFDLEEYDTALEAIEQAVELEPQNPKYLDKLVETSIMVGNKNMAKDAYRQLRMVNPENSKLDVFRDKIDAMDRK